MAYELLSHTCCLLGQSIEATANGGRLQVEKAIEAYFNSARCVCVCVHVCVHVSVCIYVHACVFACVHVSVCMHACVCACMHVCVCVCVCVLKE